MRKKAPKHRSSLQSKQQRIGIFDHLEDRQLLSPILINGTSYQRLGDPVGTVRQDGFVSIRLLSTQQGRVEADPTGAFGNDVFVISRASGGGSGGLLPDDPVNVPDASGFIYRIDPYAVNAFGGSPALNRRFFAAIPGDGVPNANGYPSGTFDLAFDPTASFAGSNAGPTLFVSTADGRPVAGTVNSRNAVYGFRPDGSSVVATSGSNPEGAFASSTLDAVHLGIPDTQIGAIAVAPGDAFGRNLYVMDLFCDQEPGVTTCRTSGDGNSLMQVFPGQAKPVNLNVAPSPVNTRVEAILPANPALPSLNEDFDIRAMAFDPNRGIILQGQFGEPAFQLFGGLFMASSVINPDLPASELTRILQFPSLGSTPFDLIAPRGIQTTLIGDMAFDPIGYFGGGIFYTDYVTQSVIEVLVDPATGFTNEITFASNFNVPTPGTNPAAAYDQPFSITFSADGEIMYVSDGDGVWAFYANTLAHTAAGTVTGVTDLRELRVPYSGTGLAAAVLDSGVDGSHLGFRGTVSAGFNTLFPGTGNFDFELAGHGTAVAGILHQIVPNAVIVPVQGYGFGDIQDLYENIRYIRDNPTVDDPRTAARESLPIVSVNMSLGVPGRNASSERNAYEEDMSTIIPLKSLFQAYLRMGIVPVASAGNEGNDFNGMNSSAIPAVINEVIEVIGSYPYGPNSTIVTSPGTPLPRPPINFRTTDPATRLECTGDEAPPGSAGDQIVFAGKVPSFSSRSRTSDFAAPGVCVNTFALSGFAQFSTAGNQAVQLGTILQEFNGTSSAAPFVTGAFVLGRDIMSQWAKVVARGGIISPTDTDPTLVELNEYLTRDLGPNTTINIAAILPLLPSFASFLNPDGINALLQWSAIPREDINLGEEDFPPTGSDDSVIQERLIFSDRFRTYSHLNFGTLLSSIEGTIGLRYFQVNPVQLDLLNRASLDTVVGGFLTSDTTLISASDIECFANSNLLVLPTGQRLLPNGISCAVASPTVYNSTSRAMARLLGGSDRVARANRLSFLDLVQNERVDNGILPGAADIAALLERLLPRVNDFPITRRQASADLPYAMDSTAVRNYHDLKILVPSGIYAPSSFPKKLRDKTPQQFRFGSRGRAGLSLLPVPGHEQNFTRSQSAELFRITGRAGDRFANAIPTQPPTGGGTNGNTGNSGVSGSTINNFASLNELGREFIYRTNDSGDLLEHVRQDDGSWSVTNLSTIASGVQIRSDVFTLDLNGPNSRAVFGLSSSNHVIRFQNLGGAWSANDLTAEASLPPVASGLTGLVLGSTTSQTIVLFGLSAAGDLIEYRSGVATWTSRNVSQEVGGPALQGTLVTWGASTRGRNERLYVYGSTADGRAYQYLSTGKRWYLLDLATALNSAAIEPGSLVVTPPSVATRGVPSLYALDVTGNLLRFTGNLLVGWQSITNMAGGPTLVGELAVQYEPGTDSTHIFGRDSQGRVVEYSGREGSWTWAVIEDAAAGSAGDLTTSTRYRVAYSELVDGALAEFVLADGWNFRRLDPNAGTPGAPDGSTASSRLIELAMATR